MYCVGQMCALFCCVEQVFALVNCVGQVCPLVNYVGKSFFVSALCRTGL